MLFKRCSHGIRREGQRASLRITVAASPKPFLLTNGAVTKRKKYDGDVNVAGNERFRYPKIRLQPSLNGEKASGVHDTILQPTMGVEANIRHDLHAKVGLSGGTTLVAEIGERMSEPLVGFAPSMIMVMDVAFPSGRFGSMG